MNDFLRRFQAKVDEFKDLSKIVYLMVKFINEKGLDSDFEDYLRKNIDALGQRD